LSTHYIGEQKLSLVTGSKLGCHVLSDFQRNSFSLVWFLLTPGIVGIPP